METFLKVMNDTIDDLTNLAISSTDIFFDGVVEKYAKRPKSLENVCLDYYAAYINIIDEYFEVQNKEAFTISLLRMMIIQ